VTLPLLASLLALGVGPLIYSRIKGAWAASAVDAFALVGVGGLVLVHILPQSFQLAGWQILPVALVGFLGPGLLCGSKLFAGKSSSRVTMPLALSGIAIHAVLDGIALTSTRMGDEPGALAAAVVLHRIPVGLGIWWLAAPLYGKRSALGLLGAIAIFSVLGFGFGETLMTRVPTSAVALFQALIAGSLMHVILRHPPAMPRPEAGDQVHGTTQAASGIGGLAAIALILALESFGAHPGHETTDHAADHGVRTHGAEALFGSADIGFIELALQSAPALLIAYLVIALMHALDLDLKRFFGRGSVVSQAVRGTAAGLPVPICSCGVIPLYRSLVVSGVPTPAAMSFLIATPELGFAALLLSYTLLGPEITLVRAGCAAGLALVVGLLVGARARTLPEIREESRTGPAKEPFATRLRKGLSYGFGDMLDGTAPWILVGLLLAGAVGGMIELNRFTALPHGLDVPLFALIGLPLYVCASGSTPLAAVLIAGGVSPGAAIAFLLTGPATNMTTFGVLAQLHGRRTALVFGFVAIFFTLILGWSTNALLSAAAAAQVPERLHGTHSGPFEIGMLVLLTLLFIASLLRQGTRGFLAQVISPHTLGMIDHDHGHGHDAHDPTHSAPDAHSCCSIGPPAEAKSTAEGTPKS